MAITFRGEDHLYAIVDTCSGAIKIGRSGDPKARMAQLQVGCPSDLYLWWEVKHGGFLEPIIHGLLGEERIRGEWYPENGVANQVLEAWEGGASWDAGTWLEGLGKALRTVAVRTEAAFDPWADARCWVNSDAESLAHSYAKARAARDEMQARMDLLERVSLDNLGHPIQGEPKLLTAAVVDPEGVVANG